MQIPKGIKEVKDNWKEKEKITDDILTLVDVVYLTTSQLVGYTNPRMVPQMRLLASGYDYACQEAIMILVRVNMGSFW